MPRLTCGTQCSSLGAMFTPIISVPQYKQVNPTPVVRTGAVTPAVLVKPISVSDTPTPLNSVVTVIAISAHFPVCGPPHNSFPSAIRAPAAVFGAHEPSCNPTWSFHLKVGQVLQRGIFAPRDVCNIPIT